MLYYNYLNFTRKMKLKSILTNKYYGSIKTGQVYFTGMVSLYCALIFSVLCTSAAFADRVRAADIYIGSKKCISCHSDQGQLWKGSHHDLAMQKADEKSVLGNFNNSTFEYAGMKSTFSTKPDGFWVNTDGPDGKLRDFKIAYTFGVYPLQQYLIGFPNGHFQALSISWDSRPKEQGGQRWFHLYPEQEINFQDPLHWTGPYHKWNSRCAECHSTNLQKNYNISENSYKTSWSEINVACESCHGPGNSHLKWTANPDQENKGFSVDLDQRGEWSLPYSGNTAQLHSDTPGAAQISICAPCHSRRVVIDEHRLGKDFLQAYTPALLTPRLYFADGQISDEVYVYGSYVQSKMHGKGVVCSSCHEPHSLKLRFEANGVCTQCHKKEVFDSSEHHHHQEGEGALCANCHMPERNYMVVDPRRDHSLRIPNPGLSEQFNTPNACNICHIDKTAQWATKALRQWFGQKNDKHFDADLLKSRSNSIDSKTILRKLAEQQKHPALVRATAMSELSVNTRADLDVLTKGLKDKDPLVRMGAVNALANLPVQYRLNYLWPLVTDSNKSVRLAVAQSLSSTQVSEMPANQQQQFEGLFDEYVEAQLVSSDMGGAHLNLGLFYTQQGKFKKAENSYRMALKLEPFLVPAFVNLADLYRIQGLEKNAMQVLMEALEIHPTLGALHHALGLSFIRQKNYAEAIEHLGDAWRFESNNSRFAYVYAVALHSKGRTAKALDVLESSYSENPADRETIQFMQTLYRQTGQRDKEQSMLNALELRGL